MKWSILLVGCVSGLSSKGRELPPDPAKVPLPQVPQATNVGQDGFPALPSMEDIMNPYSQTMSGISSRAKELEAKMMKIEKENAVRLQKQKKVFDRKLKEQEEKNQVVVKENAELAKSIMHLKQKNQAVFAESQGLQKAIAVRQSEVKRIQEQLSSVQAFLSDTLESTDLNKAELKVLDLEASAEQKETEEAKQKRKVASYFDIAQRRAEQTEKEALSFLSISEEVQEEPSKEPEPENLLGVLSEGVKDMKRQGQATSQRLKSLFLQSLRDGVKRHNALLSQQKVLQETLSSMQSYEERLSKAQQHLKDTKATLDKQLHTSGLFLQKLAQITLGNPEEGARELSAVRQSP
ncbi:unnamed protein product [Effrenium voratum]|uniref:Uncharacterized protein n=1 Tax=Effrenium voratum TaxID=2562239 RepID=A0AA36JC46_9DINO|nr:unnamed protein product [Effrenium voratum]